MKKIISLLLAVLMMFSVVTVAFAADDVADAPATEETTPEEGEGTEDSLLGEFDWILDLPFGTVGPALKIAKLVLKFAKIYVKLGLIFGFVDQEALLAPIKGIIESLIGQYAPPAEEDTAPAETTAPAVA